MPWERVCAEKGFDVYEFYFEGIFPAWDRDHLEVPKQHLFDFSDSQAKDQKWPGRRPPFKTVCHPRSRRHAGNIDTF